MIWKKLFIFNNRQTLYWQWRFWSFHFGQHINLSFGCVLNYQIFFGFPKLEERQGHWWLQHILCTLMLRFANMRASSKRCRKSRKTVLAKAARKRIHAVLTATPVSRCRAVYHVYCGLNNYGCPCTRPPHVKKNIFNHVPFLAKLCSNNVSWPTVCFIRPSLLLSFPFHVCCPRLLLFSHIRNIGLWSLCS